MEKTTTQTAAPQVAAPAGESFSSALALLKDGKLVARLSWDNTKYLFISKDKKNPSTVGGILVKGMVAGGPPNRFNLHELDILAADWVEVTIS